MIKKVLFSITVSVFSLFMILPICNVSETNAAVIEDDSDAEINSQYRWYYKEVDGVRYMRLWDGTAHCWVTDWIPVD